MKRSWLILFISIIAAQAFAQTITLPDAVNIALKNSLDIQLSKNNVQISTINNYIGIAGGLPLVTGSATDNESVTSVRQTRNTGEKINGNNASGNSAAANITGSILLYNGSYVVATKKRLEEIQHQGEDQLNSLVQNTMATVMNGYFNIVRQQGLLKTIDLSIDVAQKKLDIIKARQEVGLANNADLFQAQVDLSNLVQSRESQLLIIAQAQTELLRLLTLRPDSTIDVKDTIIVDNSLTLESVMNNLHANADVLAADEQIKINQLAITQIASQRYPSLRASAGYTYSRAQSQVNNLTLNQGFGPYVGIGLSIPIYNGSVYKRQQKIAEINTVNAGIQKDIVLRDYKADVVKSYQSYISNLQQLDAQRKNYELSKQ
ncbi:MAG TPA: TolC family protein, partial [Chitinophagaceae bacterium]